MATNLFHGRKGIVQTAATSSGTAANLGRVRNFSLDVTAEMIDVTNMDSSGWRELIDGTKSWEFTAEALWLSTAATTKQDDLRSALSSEARQWFKFQNSTAAGSQTFQGWGYVASWNLSADQSDVQVHNFSISGDGSIAES